MSFSIARSRAHASHLPASTSGRSERPRGQGPCWGASFVLFGCVLLEGTLTLGCTLTSESYDPPVIERERREGAALEPQQPTGTEQEQAASDPDQTPTREQLPSDVDLDPGETRERELGVEPPASDAGASPADGGAPSTDPPDDEPNGSLDAGPPSEPEPEPEPEPCAGSTFGGNCYEFFGVLSAWAPAEASCVSWGGHLASVQSSEENAFLDRWAAELGIPAGNGAGLWLGGADSAQDDNFRWSDGSPFTFPGWAANQPNDGVGAADCVEKRNDGTGWYDRRCTDSLAFVCEQPL